MEMVPPSSLLWRVRTPLNPAGRCTTSKSDLRHLPQNFVLVGHLDAHHLPEHERYSSQYRESGAIRHSRLPALHDAVRSISHLPLLWRVT
jgi:hypothetical protein